MSIVITPTQQPTPRTCAHTCLAMVTGANVDDLIARFGDRPLGFSEEASVLIEHGIFPVKATGNHHEFAIEGVYLVSTPSLNLPGKLHMVVVEASADGYIVHDPNTGCEGVQAYEPDSLMSGDLSRCEVTYLDTRILSESVNTNRFDLVAHMHRQIEFSIRAFGPGDRVQGLVNHIRKELIEIEADPSDLEEWIDVVLLGLDGAWRAGNSPEQVAKALNAKLTKNEQRTWPDWRTADRTKAIEHDRSTERQLARE